MKIFYPIAFSFCMFSIAVSAIKTQAQAPSKDLVSTIEVVDEKIEEALPPRVVILLDSSGSMAQPLDEKKSKMFYAKKLFGSYLKEQWKEKAEVGLVVYGSRRKEDCTDTYLAIPFKERNLGIIDLKVKGLIPTGMTPIADSLQLAVDQLKTYAGPKRIMIFTDGEETCGGDSCKILEKAIQEKVFDLEMFVTGIGMKENARDLDNLRCLGKTFGGSSEKELQQSLSDIDSQIHKNDPKKGPNLYVESPNPKAKVKIFRWVAGKKEFLRSFTGVYGTRLEPGSYSAEVEIEPPFIFEKFEIPENKKVILKVSGKGALEVKFFDHYLDVEVFDKNKKLVAQFQSDEQKILPSGRYDIRVSGGSFYEYNYKDFDIVPGGNHEIPIEGLGVVQVDFEKVVGFSIFNSAEKEIGKQLTNFPFVMKAGNYTFKVHEKCKINGITVRPDRSVQVLQCLK